MSLFREFLMAEIEYFVDPESKDHPKFDSVADLKVRLYSRDRQMAGEAAVDVTLKQAIDQVNFPLYNQEAISSCMLYCYLFAGSFGCIVK